MKEALGFCILAMLVVLPIITQPSRDEAKREKDLIDSLTKIKLRLEIKLLKEELKQH